jgi:hypothetical protein
MPPLLGADTLERVDVVDRVLRGRRLIVLGESRPLEVAPPEERCDAAIVLPDEIDDRGAVDAMGDGNAIMLWQFAIDCLFDGGADFDMVNPDAEIASALTNRLVVPAA